MQGYSDLWKAIIRPPRDEYDLIDLGPSHFQVLPYYVRRQDLSLTNPRGLRLECSFYQQVNRPCSRLPCVVYLHGNSSSRVEAIQNMNVLLSQGIQVFSFDFSGCGKSEGEYISLGWYERDDLCTVIDYLRKSNMVSTIGLWGRSMGAITAMMHADRDPSIAGLVLDSGFASLREVAEDLCMALSFLRSTIKSKAHFDIDTLRPIDHVKSAFIPAFFIAAKDDSFILPKHTKSLHQYYAGDKNLVECQGDHNSIRPAFLQDSIAIFFYNTLQCDQLIRPSSPQSLSCHEQYEDQEEESQKGPETHIGNHEEVKRALGIFGGQRVTAKLAKEQFGREVEQAIQESLKNNSRQSQPQNKIQKHEGDDLIEWNDP